MPTSQIVKIDTETTKTKPKHECKRTGHSPSARTAYCLHQCMLLCTIMQYTTEHRTAVIFFPLKLPTVILLLLEGRGCGILVGGPHNKHIKKTYAQWHNSVQILLTSELQ